MYVGICIPKITFRVYFRGHWNGNVGIFYGHSVYFNAVRYGLWYILHIVIWYNLWSLVYFFPFWYVVCTNKNEHNIVQFTYPFVVKHLCYQACTYRVIARVKRWRKANWHFSDPAKELIINTIPKKWGHCMF
jgi:hypothetical protein